MTGAVACSPQEEDQDGTVRAVTVAAAKWPDRRSVWIFRPGVQSGCASRVKPLRTFTLGLVGGRAVSTGPAVAGNRHTVASAR